MTLNNRDLEIWVKDHSRSFKLVLYESLGAVSYSPCRIFIIIIIRRLITRTMSEYMTESEAQIIIIRL